MFTPAPTLLPAAGWWPRLGAFAVLGSLTLGTSAWADDSMAERMQVSRDMGEPQVTIERAWLQSGAAAPVDAQGRPLADMAGVSVRWWSRHGRSNVGLGFGTVGFVAPGLEDHGQASGSLRAAVPALTVGWRYRVSNGTAVYADATGARSLAMDASPGLYNAKVGMEWQPAKSRLGFENRSLGIELQSGYRMSLRVKSGGLGLYFRGKF